MNKILLVADDSKTIKKAFELSFTGKDIDLIFANDGQSALMKAKKQKPGVVIADHKLPGLNGYDLLSEMKREAGLGKIPFIIMHSHYQEFDEVKGVGAEDHIAKPFLTKEIHEVVDKAFEVVQSGVSEEVEQEIIIDAEFPDEEEAPDELELQFENLGLKKKSNGMSSASKPARPVVPRSSKPAAPQRPARPAVPRSSKPAAPQRPARPAVPRSSKPAVPQKPARPAVPRSSKPVVPQKPARPSVPRSSKPAAPQRPARPAVPGANKEEKAQSTFAPPPSRPVKPEAPKATKPGVPEKQKQEKSGKPFVSSDKFKKSSKTATAGTKKSGGGQTVFMSSFAPTPAQETPTSEKSSQTAENEQIKEKVVQDTQKQVKGIVDKKVREISAQGEEFKAIANLSRDIIEKIAWEVVPQLAEVIIKEIAVKDKHLK
ncbi:MAG: response regulator [Deltaproteobacteria bacterium]|jgi:DNA-binding response OmpR family regulator|nr:response regulator [Deltaproteobacteria bacterium]